MAQDGHNRFFYPPSRMVTAAITIPMTAVPNPMIILADVLFSYALWYPIMKSRQIPSRLDISRAVFKSSTKKKGATTARPAIVEITNVAEMMLMASVWIASFLFRLR